jgi:YbbR domain-containing protein
VRADWPLKLLALAIAFTLWVSITGEDQAVRDLDLPVAVQLDPHHVLANTTLKTVSVRLQGPRTVIRNIDPVALSVRLDLRDTAAGAMEVPLSERNLAGLPRRVNVAFFEPDRLSLVIVQTMRRELPVAADLVGELPAGFTVYEAHVQPGRATVEGPEGVVGSLTELRTSPLRLEHRTRPFREAVTLVLERPELRVVDPQRFEVQVLVEATPVRRTFADVPIVVPGGSGKRSVRPGTARVTVSGPPAIVESLSASQIRAVVAAESESRAAVQVSVVDLPEQQRAFVKVVAVQPASVALEGEGRKADA